MKKITKITAIILSLVIAISSIPLINAAQDGTKVLWSNSFEDDEAKWDLVDYDGDGQNWEVRSKEKDGLAAYDGDKSLYSGSLGVGNKLNNIAISKEIAFNTSAAKDIKFIWHVGTTGSYKVNEHYCLYFFTGDCSDKIIEEGVLTDGEVITDENGKTIGYRIKSETLSQKTSLYQDREENIKELLSELCDGEDKSIRIAIRHHEGLNQSALKIDDLKIEATYSFIDIANASYTFDNGAQGWSVIDGNRDGYNWELKSFSGGNDCFASASYADGRSIIPENYLVSPPIQIDSGLFNSHLEWDIGAADKIDYKENYSVYIYKGTEELNEGNIKNNLGTLIHTETLQNDEFTHRSVFLDDCSGKTIRIIFVHHNCSGQYYIKLDNVSLSAVEKKVYTAIFNANEGAWSDGTTEKTVTAFAGETIDKPEDPVKAGFKFDGWEGFTGTMPSANVTYKAIWKENTEIQYKLEVYEMDTTGTWPDAPTRTIIFNDGVKDEIRTISYESPAGFTLDDNLSVLEGTIAADGKVMLEDGNTIDAFKVYLKRNTYNANFYLTKEDAAAGKAYATVETFYGEEIAFPSDPSMSGKEFEGWDNEETVMGAGNMTFIATWWDIEYFVEFYDEAGEIIAEDIFFWGDEIAADFVEKPTKEGYEFKYWTVDGKPVTLPVTVNNGIIAEGSNTIILKPYFAANKYKATFDANGGTFAEGVNNVYEGIYESTIVAPADPTYRGYDFGGWEGYAEGDTMPAENVTFKAIWTAHVYKVNYYVNGELVHTDDVAFGATVPAYTYVPEDAGISFAGWGEADPAGKAMPAEDINVYASTGVNTYNVTFTIDGEEYAVLPFAYGAAVTAPTYEIPEGYTFSDWDVPAAMPAQNITLDATLTANTYKVTWIVPDQENQVEDVVYGAEIKTPTYTKEGYELVWTWTNEAGETVAAPTTMPAGDITITAQWIKTYTATFKVDGAVYGTPVTGATGTEIAAPEAPSKDGFVFKGWAVEGTTEIVTFPQTIGDSDVTYTAIWETTVLPLPPSPQTVTIPDNGMVGSGNVASEDKTVIFNADGGVFADGKDKAGMDFAEVIIAPGAPSKVGHSIKGWKITDNLPDKLTITATWNINKYMATFDANGGQFNLADGKTTDKIENKVTYNEGITVPANLTREGYTFAGWDKEVPATMPGSNIEFKAEWEKESYKIIFDAKGGSVNPASIEKKYGDDITLPTPSKTGFVFDGWVDAEGNAVNYTKVPDLGDNNVEVKYTAKWTNGTFNAIFMVDGAVYETVSTEFGAAIKAPANPTKTGYTFTGWTPTVGNMDAEGKTFAAEWEKESYKIIFNAGEGVDDPDPIEKEYGDEITLPTPSKTGFVFDGWVDAEGNAVNYTKVPDLGDNNVEVKYTAKWTKGTFNAIFMVDGAVYATVPTAFGEAIKAPVAPTKVGYTFTGWTPVVGNMDTEGKTFTAVYKYSSVVSGDIIKTPSITTISYGDSITLHVDDSKIPAGGKVVWSAENDNFSYKANGATCKISPAKNGSTTFTATIYDADRNAILEDKQTMTSKAGFFDKIIAFFKGLFGMTKDYPDFFKF